MLEISRWLADEHDDASAWPGIAALAPARLAQARHGAILLPFRALLAAIDAARSERCPAETAQARRFLRDGAIMLGVALVFVTLFRRLGLGATLGYIVAGALIGPSILGLFNEPEALQRVSPKSASRCCCSSSGWSFSRADCGGFARISLALGWRRSLCAGLRLAAILYFGPGFSPEASLAIGLPLGLSSTAQVLPMLRSDNELNTPQGERAFSILLFQDLVDRSADHDHRRDGTGGARPDSSDRLEAGALHPAGRHRTGAGRPAHPQPLVSADRPARRARAVRCRRAFHSRRRRCGDAHFGPSVAARRIRRRRRARRIALPARARKRRRAVPLDLAGPVFPVGRNAARPERSSRRGRCL